MTDKEYKLQKARVNKLLNKWYPMMGVNSWRITYQWSQSPCQDAPTTVGETNSLWQYKKATITWFLPAMVDIDDDHLQDCVIHELLHLVIDPLYDAVDGSNEHIYKLNELVTQSLTYVVQNAYLAGKKQK